MSYRLTIASPEDRDLVVTSLRNASDQRARVARKASAEVMGEKRREPGKDVRSGAVKVTALLDEADRLADLADQLEQAPELAIVSVAPGDPAKVIDARTGQPAEPDPADDPLDLGHLDDDGTSPEAQRLAELAGLEPANPDAPPPVEDPVTHELPEDRAGGVEDVAALALGTPDGDAGE